MGTIIYQVIKENPYQMADDIDGVGFRIADEIASKAGIHTDSDFRIRCGLLYVLQQAAMSEGTRFSAGGEFWIKRTVDLLGVSQEACGKTSLWIWPWTGSWWPKETGGRVCVYGAQAYYVELNTAKMLS